MNYLITGGAGFIGSHLADRLVAQGRPGRPRRRPVDRPPGQRPAPGRTQGRPSSSRSRSWTRGSCASSWPTPTWSSIWPPSVGVQLIVEHPLDVAAQQHPRDRGRSWRPARDSGDEGPGRLHVRDLRQERPGPSARRRGSHPRLAVRRPLVVQHLEGRRRDPGPRLLAGTRHRRRSSFGSSTPSDRGRPGAYGMVHPPVRRAGAARGAAHGLRHGSPAPLLLPRARHGGGADGAARPPRRRRVGLQRRRAERDDDGGAGALRDRDDGVHLVARPRPVRRRLRGGVRGHGADGSPTSRGSGT